VFGKTKIYQEKKMCFGSLRRDWQTCP
jgi:hypothetical protein